ncbi:MAG: MOSC domain-containing protein [Chloroflexi bacterium]|nr:MOSC domain-containing protein [Chloroflexota bacterium]
MQVISLTVGTPQTQTYGGKLVLTAGHKAPVESARLSLTNFEGDWQADLKNHGGAEKAVCAYSFEHYPFWEEWLGEKLSPGAFSENLTISGLHETDVCIGDVFRVGEALLQISQPRQPCSKLAGKRGRKDLPQAIHENGFSGFYLRVLREGMVRVGDSFEWASRHPDKVTVAFANQVMYRHRTDPHSLYRVLAVPELSIAWRETLSQRI